MKSKKKVWKATRSGLCPLRWLLPLPEPALYSQAENSAGGATVCLAPESTESSHQGQLCLHTELSHMSHMARVCLSAAQWPVLGTTVPSAPLQPVENHRCLVWVRATSHQLCLFPILQLYSSGLVECEAHDPPNTARNFDVKSVLEKIWRGSTLVS